MENRKWNMEKRMGRRRIDAEGVVAAEGVLRRRRRRAEVGRRWLGRGTRRSSGEKVVGSGMMDAESERRCARTVGELEREGVRRRELGAGVSRSRTQRWGSEATWAMRRPGAEPEARVWIRERLVESENAPAEGWRA